MTKPTRADGIIRKRRERDPNRFENLKKNKYGTPLKESKKESRLVLADFFEERENKNRHKYSIK